MTFPPQRLSLAAVLLITAGTAHGKTVQIDTATTAAQTLGGSDTLTISAPGSITNSGKAVSLKDGTSGAGVVIDNAGKIVSSGGRAIDSSGDLTQARNYQIYNRSGGQILGANDALRIDSNFVSGSLLIDNSGTSRSTTGQGLDLDTRLAALLFDIPADLPDYRQILEQRFGVTVADLVHGIARLAPLRLLTRGEDSAIHAQTEVLRKMLLAMVEDIKRQRDRMIAALHELGYTPLPSAAPAMRLVKLSTSARSPVWVATNIAMASPRVTTSSCARCAVVSVVMMFTPRAKG